MGSAILYALGVLTIVAGLTLILRGRNAAERKRAEPALPIEALRAGFQPTAAPVVEAPPVTPEPSGASLAPERVDPIVPPTAPEPSQAPPPAPTMPPVVAENPPPPPTVEARLAALLADLEVPAGRAAEVVRQSGAQLGSSRLAHLADPELRLLVGALDLGWRDCFGGEAPAAAATLLGEAMERHGWGRATPVFPEPNAPFDARRHRAPFSVPPGTPIEIWRPGFVCGDAIFPAIVRPPASSRASRGGDGPPFSRTGV